MLLFDSTEELTPEKRAKRRCQKVKKLALYQGALWQQ